MGKMHAPGEVGAATLVVAKDGKQDELAALLSRWAASFSEDEGTEIYAVYRQRKTPGTFLILEQFSDEAGRKRHLANPIASENRDLFASLVASTQVTIGDAIGV